MFVRCPQDKGFLAHSFITDDGQDVYRCTREDAYNDNGRFFLITSAGAVEVTPVAHRGKRGYSWSVEIVDHERRRVKEETERINAELDRRAKLYRNNMAEMLERFKYDNKYGVDEE